MAAIDKTYAKTWKEYQEMKEWLSNQRKFKTRDGYEINLIDCLFDWLTEEDFDGKTDRPIMSTSCVEDYYLIKNCDVPFYQEWMKKVYEKDYIKSIKEGTSEYDTFSKEGKYGTKVRIVKSPKLANYNHPYKSRDWSIQLIPPQEYFGIWYEDELDKWFWPYELGDGHSNTAFAKSLKGAIRKIRKWKLPKGTKIQMFGRYEGDEYELLVY